MFFCFSVFFLFFFPDFFKCSEEMKMALENLAVLPPRKFQLSAPKLKTAIAKVSLRVKFWIAMRV